MSGGLIWWFDRCLGRELPNAIEALGAEVRRYVDLFPNDPTVDDVDWIPRVTARGWVIVTKDKNIRRDSNERAVLIAARARYVCLASANMTGKQQVETLTGHWRTIDGVVRTRAAPLLVSVTRDGVVWWDGEAWRAVKRKPPRGGGGDNG